MNQLVWDIEYEGREKREHKTIKCMTDYHWQRHIIIIIFLYYELYE